MKVAILGAGAWGTALAIHLSQYHQITLWTKASQHCVALTAERVNQSYLPDFTLPDTLNITADLHEAIGGVDLILIVVPIAGLRETLRNIVNLGEEARAPVLWGCKGFESEAAKLPHEIVSEEYPDHMPVGVLSGPSFAQEVAKCMPTALTLASQDDVFSAQMAAQLHNPRLRVYTSRDVVGVEIGGAIKNVITIAAGISDGMGFGYNARAALVTRGLMEMTRLGVKLGGQKETFLGLSGVGDLMLTCTGDLSRNRQVGLLLAEGCSLSDILHKLGHVAEGVHTAQEVLRLSQKLGVEMPITQAVCDILYKNVSAGEAVEALLGRSSRSEVDEL